jgi:hypothetical protein
MATMWLEGIKNAMANNKTIQPQVPHNLQQLAESQAAIGWKQLLKGRMSSQWIIHQHAAMEESSTKRIYATGGQPPW